MSPHWVCVDVGETLIDETRLWSLWAEVLDVPFLTFAAATGAAIATRGDHLAAFDLLDVDEWWSCHDEVQRRYGGFTDADLYPDAHRALGALADAGYRVAVVANQPARRHAELDALGIRPEVMAMSEALGVAKPDAGFYAAALALMGDPDPGDVAYVGDRVDNDVLPARAAGLKSVWLRRGPWGRLQDDGGAADLVAASLDEVVRRVGELWA